MDWLHETASAIEARCGVVIDELLPTSDERRVLLNVARVAAHTSGDRTNAPLLCYVLGRAVERGVALDEAIGAVTDEARDLG